MENAHTQSYHVKVSGGNIYVKKWIPTKLKNKEPIVLLHDSLGCVALWKEFPSALAEYLDREVIAYDRLGFGQSSSREGLPSNEFVWEEADIYFPMVKQQLLLKNYVLFGHSVGGSMSVGIAASDSDCVAVITESSQAFVEELTLNGLREAQKLFQQEGQIDRLKKWHGDKANWVLSAWLDVWLSPDFVSWSLEPYINKVLCPILAIHGENDEYGSVAFPEFIVEKSGGNAEMLIMGDCGHVPHRQHSQSVLDAVKQFLR